MYKNYIFDLYGTLIDINTNERKRYLWEKISEFYGFNGAIYSALELKKDYLAQCEKLLSEPSKYNNPEIEILDVFRFLYMTKEVNPSDDLVLRTAQFFRILSTKYLKLYDGVIELFNLLREKNKKIYLLSNAQRSFTEYEMRYLQIYDLFDGIVISSDEQCQKPDVNFYNIVLDRYNLKKQESIMVGNDATSDIKGSYEAGLDSLYIHSNISPEVKGTLLSKFSIMDGDFTKVAKMIVK